jgi:serine protease AprX
MKSWRRNASNRAGHRNWFRRSILVGSAALSIAVLGMPNTAQASLLGGSTAPYIVSDTSGTGVVVSLVEELGGVINSTLGLVDAVSAQLSSLQVSLLKVIPGVVVTPDVNVLVEGSIGPSGRAPAAVYPEQTGATQLWAEGDTGAGVNVAVLDTGIDPLPDFAGRLVAGVDLSGGGNAFSDGYGHGTFVAGLIAGNGASSDGAYVGEAPGAGLVSVKVANASGQTSLSTVIEGVSWVVANAAQDHIRVLNMSLGYLPIESTLLDPLDQAVEKAWNAGIVVVTSAGNSGPSNGSILSPGDDPLVITAGALDDQGQTNPADDVMPSFSSVGPTSPDGLIKPDLVASGRSVVSLRAPGSTIDTEFPSARVGTANFVGSGTSFSAAIVSGAAALLLAAHPSDTPNMVKATLLGTTLPGPVGNPFVDGHGDLDVERAVASPQMGMLQLNLSLPALNGATVLMPLTWAVSTWDSLLWTGLGLQGPFPVGSPLKGLAWNGSAWNGSVWRGMAWNALSWTGMAWNGLAWNGLAWNGMAWNGLAWNGSSWN